MPPVTPSQPKGRLRVLTWILLGVIILAALVIGGYLYLMALTTKIESGENTMNPSSGGSGDTAAAIENELNQVDIDNLDAELNDIDREIKSK